MKTRRYRKYNNSECNCVDTSLTKFCSPLLPAVAPVCRPGQETVQGVGRRETAKVVCEVEANPSDNVRYTWRFNNSRETIDLDRDRYTEEGPRSTAAYTPLTPLDYGTAMCWASNEFGKQSVPCVYHVIAAGKCFSLDGVNFLLVLSAIRDKSYPLIALILPRLY